jgi:hypothetical protein
VGSRHGIVHGATLTSDRFGNANRAYYFDEQSGAKITIPAPFDNPSSDFTISVWISPAVVGDGTWHGFVGYQPETSEWQDRSPSLFLNNEGNGQTCGLHYDSYDNEGQTRFSGVISYRFEQDMYVHTLWAGVAGGKYTFYKNGAATARNYPAPALFYLHNSYTIGAVGAVGQLCGHANTKLRSTNHRHHRRGRVLWLRDGSRRCRQKIFSRRTIMGWRYSGPVCAVRSRLPRQRWKRDNILRAVSR